MSREAVRPAHSAIARQNEYFIPGDGIDHAVITADICRYLGNDALVRPGTYLDEGRLIQGYYVTAFRTLTTAMVADLRNDSARFNQEIRRLGRRLRYTESTIYTGLTDPSVHLSDKGGQGFHREQSTFLHGVARSDYINQAFSDSGYASASNNRHPMASAVFVHSVPLDSSGPLNQDAAVDDSVVEHSSSSDDDRTIYSDARSMAGEGVDAYVTELVGSLMATVRAESMDAADGPKLCDALPALLKTFALRLGYDAPSQMHRDIMYFVSRNRDAIVRKFREQLPNDQQSTFSEGSGSPKQKLPETRKDLEERTFQWMDTWEEDTHDPSSILLIGSGLHEQASLDDQDDELPIALGLSEYRKLISEAPEYQSLLATIRNATGLEFPESDTLNNMDGIQRYVLNSSPKANKILSRHRSPEACRITFHVDWAPASFISAQEFRDPRPESLRTAVTLTGTNTNAQALSCSQYVSHTWPCHGEVVLSLIVDTVKKPPSQHSTIARLQDGTRLEAHLDTEGKLVIAVFGLLESAAEIAQQLAWLGSALRFSPNDSGLVYCAPSLSPYMLPKTLRPARSDKLTSREDAPEEASYDAEFPEAHLLISFCFEECGQRPKEANVNGQCWHGLFRNPVIARGFPIAARQLKMAGLELPLHLASQLIDAKNIDKFGSGTFLKGFSCLAVAMDLKHVANGDDFVLWHLLYNEDGSRISYQDQPWHRSIIRASDLQGARHIIGWCPDVAYHVGGPLANYRVKPTHLPEASLGCILQKATISGGQFITAGLEFSLGNRERPIHIAKDGYIAKLNWISQKYVVFWDDEDKRGWLVNGLAALLHLLRGSLEHNRTDKFKSSFLFQTDSLKEADGEYGPASVIEILTNESNKSLPIYAERTEGTQEESGGRYTQRPDARIKRYYNIQDRVEHLFGIMEKIIDYHTDAERRGGLMLFRSRGNLEGWDYKEMITGKDPLHPRVATIHNLGKGWIDLVRGIGAVTILGRGFGELLEPRHSFQGKPSCPRWARLPKTQYYLAVSITDLREIMEAEGDEHARPRKLCPNILWHSRGSSLQNCPCTALKPEAGREVTHYDPVQTIFPLNFLSRFPRREPIELKDEGAVIFGYNRRIHWHWKDVGDPVQGDLLHVAEWEASPVLGVGNDNDTTGRSAESSVSPKQSDGSSNLTCASGSSAPASELPTPNTSRSGRSTKTEASTLKDTSGDGVKGKLKRKLSNLWLSSSQTKKSREM